MLNHIEMRDKATIINNALEKTLSVKESRTKDLGGNSNTKEFADAIISNLNG